jgi:hypothetical protein
MSISMNSNPLAQLHFTGTKKSNKIDMNNPKTKADFTALLKAAKPCGHFLGDFKTPAVVVDENKMMVVSPDYSKQPVGGGAIDYLFYPDGSVSKRQHGPVVAPQYRRPPTITPILPAGSIDSKVLEKRQKEVAQRQAELS